MERHKNYQDILSQHKRRQRNRLVRLLLYIVALIALLIIVFLALNKIGSLPSEKETRPATAHISRPDIEFSPNKFDHGTTQKPPA